VNVIFILAPQNNSGSSDNYRRNLQSFPYSNLQIYLFSHFVHQINHVSGKN